MSSSEEQRYIYRVEVSFTVDVLADDRGEAERMAYDAMMRGEFNVGPNGECVADVYTQVMEVLEADEDDLVDLP